MVKQNDAIFRFRREKFKGVFGFRELTEEFIEKAVKKVASPGGRNNVDVSEY